MEKLKNNIDDILLVTGYAMIFFGVWQLSPPAAWIVGGFLAIAGGWLYAKAMQPIQTIERQMTDDEVAERSR
jgi:hypothetical protein